MKFNFRHVEIFWAEMTTGSATGAAQLLRTSQPTISRELVRFEQTVKLKLFNRSNGKLEPTEQGMMLFDEVQRTYNGLARVAHAADAIRNFDQGQISIASLPVFAETLLPNVCQQFSDAYPGVSVKITSQETPQLRESLSKQNYHLGLSEDAAALPGTHAQQLMAADVVCVLPAAHAMGEKVVVTPDDLAGQKFVYLDALDPYRQQVDALFGGLGIERKMVIETLSASAVCQTVRLGVGVAIVNPLTALSFAGTGLQIRRFSYSIPYSVNLIRPLYRPESPVADNFIEVLRANCVRLSLELASILDRH